MKISRPDIKVKLVEDKSLISSGWKYEVLTIGNRKPKKPIFVGEVQKYGNEFVLGYWGGKTYEGVFGYSKDSENKYAITIDGWKYIIYQNELSLDHTSLTFTHFKMDSIKETPKLDIKIGQKYLTENGGIVKILAFEPKGDFAIQDQWIGIITRTGNIADGSSIRFDKDGIPLSHGGNIGYSLVKKYETTIIQTLIWNDNGSIRTLASNPEHISAMISNLESKNIKYKLVQTKVEPSELV